MLDKLQKVPMCRGLSSAEAGQLASIAEEAQSQQGAVLFKEGDSGDSIVVVVEGTVEVTKSGQKLTTIGGGSVLGEMSLLGEGGRRTATATALTDLKLVKINAARFRELLAKNDLAALKVVANLALVMSKRLLEMNQRLIDDKKGKKEELADFQRILSDWSF